MTGSVRCPLCHSSRSSFEFTEKGYEVQRCHVCDLLFLHPYPEVEDAHGKVLDNAYTDLDVIGAQAHYESSRFLYSTIAPKVLPECEGAEAFLDVGCGTGRLLELVREAYPGITRMGVELNRSRAEYARKVGDCQVLNQPLELVDAPRRFDVVSLINLLSHLPDFDLLFEALDRFLVPDGKVILQVGELGPDLPQAAIFDWGIPSHLHFLGTGTLPHLAERFGYRIVRHERQPRSDVVYDRSRFEAPGRSRGRDLLKKLVSRTPGLLGGAKALHEWRFGRGSAFESFVVLAKL